MAATICKGLLYVGDFESFSLWPLLDSNRSCFLGSFLRLTLGGERLFEG